MRWPYFLAAGAILLAGSGARAQQPTTVQLPTFRVFTVQTTVSVPDSGGALLGGIHRARDGRMTRGIGPLASRAGGSDRGTSGVSVHATVIDHREIDEALLAAAARRRGETVDPAVARADHLSRHVAGTSGVALAAPSGGNGHSLAEIRRQNAAVAVQRASEAADYLAKGQQAEADGKPAVARVYYQMAARRDAGEAGQQASQRLAALASTTMK